MIGNLKSSALVGALLVVSAGASQAAITTGGVGSGASGELFINIWDVQGQSSFSLDLGINANTIVAGVAPLSWNLADATVAPLFGAIANGIAQGHEVRYNVAAVNLNTLVTAASPAWGVLSTFSNSAEEMATAAADTVTRIAGIQQIGSATVSHINTLNTSALNHHVGATATDFGANLDEVSGSADESYFDNLWGGDFGGQIGNGKVTDGTVGQALDFYLMGWAGVGNRTRFVQLETFKLNAAGVLTYGAAPVPLPAGVWGLSAALATLLGLARRRA